MLGLSDSIADTFDSLLKKHVVTEDGPIELQPGKSVTRDWVPVQPMTARPTKPRGRAPRTVDA